MTRIGRLGGVQALRGAAASAVVLSHAARHVNKVLGAPALIGFFQAGHAGVDLFFVISGFIILFVHHPDIGRADRLRRYLGRRFNRVMPLYWIALGITIAMSALGKHAFPPAGRMIWSALLLPSSAEPLLGIAWTLQYELVFYAVFALFIVNRMAGFTVFLAWLIMILVNAAGYSFPGLPAPLCGAYGLEFFMGLAAAYSVLHDLVPAARAVAVTGATLFLSALMLESIGLLDGFGTLARLAYGPAALLLVAGFATAERRGRLRIPAPLEAVGSASYSIYLFQFVFIGLVWQAWLRAGLARHASELSCFAVLAFAAIGGGVLASRLIEQPLLRMTRAPLRKAAETG